MSDILAANDGKGQKSGRERMTLKKRPPEQRRVESDDLKKKKKTLWLGS